MKTPIKIDSIEINLLTSDSMFTLWKDGDYIDFSESELVELFDAEPLHFATALEDIEFSKAFNTYNYGSPIVACGVCGNEMEIALVNFHRGGDARGNYGSPYVIEGYDNVTALLIQQTELSIMLSNGEKYALLAGNSEAYFSFDTFDYDASSIEELVLTDEMYTEITEKMEAI